jgi:hypothetical protein
MDGTRAGAGTGGNAAPAGHTADDPAGPTRPAGRADATGPLPVPAPADPTGPLPATPDGSWFDPADQTAAQPTVDPAATPPATTSPPSWFATGPLPLVPAADPASSPQVAAAPGGGLFDAPDPAGTAAATAPPSPPPVSLFEPAGPPPVTAPQPVAAGAGPDSAPTTGLLPTARPQPTVTPGPAPPADPLPATGLFPAVGTAQPVAAGTTAPDPAPTTGLLPTARPQPTVTPAPAAPADPPPTGLFPAVGPPQPPAAPTGRRAAPTGDFPAVPAPAGPPVRPADATGPMPTIGVAEAPVPSGAAMPDAAASSTAAGDPGPSSPPTSGTEAPPRTHAWSFAAAGPPRTEAWSSEDRHGGTTQSWPLPTPSGRAHSTGAIPLAGSAPAGARSPVKRSSWPLTLAGVVVAVAAGIALVFSLARTDPADLAVTAAAEVGSWPGVRYQGAVAALDGGEIRFDVTVTADGATGTLSRDGGRATAELRWDRGGALLRANREWWLYHHPTRADDLADTWVADPLTETREIDPVLQLPPPALAEHVRGESPGRWEALEQQLVDGQPGIVLSDGARRVVVGGDDPHPLLAVDVTPGASTPPVQVGRPTGDEVAAVVGAAAQVRQEAAPRTLTQLLLERPKVEIQLQPEPLCTAQTCNVTVTVTNSGTAPARGRLEISADGQVVGNHPLDLHPGQVATFTGTAPNPQFAQPGATGQILWESRAVDD